MQNKKQEISQEIINLVVLLQSQDAPSSEIRKVIRKETGWGRTKAGEVYKQIIKKLPVVKKQIKIESSKPKILLVDIETAPSLGYVWGKWEQDVIKFKDNWYILSFAFKWLDDKKIQFRGLPNYKGYKSNMSNDKSLMQELWDLFDEADIVIAHHGDGFDVKKSNARFAFHGFTPPSPYKSVDTLKIARRYFKFDSNKLDDLAQYLGVGKKMAHEGPHTWFGCMQGDLKSWDIMRKYNSHDIFLLEGVYLKLRAWTTSHPNLNNFTKNEACPVCQSMKVQKRGINVSKTGYRERFQCQEIGCGAWFSGIKHFKTN